MVQREWCGADLREGDGAEANLARALPLGESLGFLFDADLTRGGADVAGALDAWRELVGDGLDSALAREGARERAGEAAPLRSAPLLTKFRRPSAEG